MPSAKRISTSGTISLPSGNTGRTRSATIRPHASSWQKATVVFIGCVGTGARPTALLFIADRRTRAGRAATTDTGDRNSYARRKHAEFARSVSYCPARLRFRKRATATCRASPPGARKNERQRASGLRGRARSVRPGSAGSTIAGTAGTTPSRFPTRHAGEHGSSGKTPG